MGLVVSVGAGSLQEVLGVLVSGHGLHGSGPELSLRGTAARE